MKLKLHSIQFTKALSLPALIFVSALPAAFGQLAIDADWTGTDDDNENWNVAANWDPSGVPGTGSSAGIRNGDFVATTDVAAPDLIQLAVNSSSTLYIAHSLGIVGTPFIDNPDPDPDVQPTGGLYLGGNGLGNGSIEIGDGGVLSITHGNFRLGNGGGGGGAGVINVASGGTLSVSGVGTRIGQDATGEISMTGTGVFTTDSEIIIGTEGGGLGTYSQTGGTLTHTSGDFRVGAFGATGVCNISGGTANIVNLRLSFSGSGTGTINQSGTSIVNLDGDFAIGWANSGDATYNMQGGTLNSNGRIRYGIGNAVRTNKFHQTGGIVIVNNRIDIGEDSGPTNIYDISSGSVTLTGGDKRLMVGAFNDSTGTLNVSGDALVDIGDLVFGDGGTAAGTANLNGGTLSLVKIYSGGSTAPAQYLNLNGSTLKAKQSDGNFITGSTLVVDLQAGGCTIDNNGFDLAVSSVIGGVGTLTKRASGILALYADNTYEGGTEIAGGLLQLANNAKLGSITSDYTLTFDAGALKNMDSEIDLSANRTVVLADDSWGSLVAGWGKRISVAGRITGGGELWIANEGGPVRLDNPANDYTGNTVIGDVLNGYAYATEARLRLGADNVIPDASMVVFNGDQNINANTVTGILEMNGHDEAISGLQIQSGNASIRNGTGSATLSVGANDTDSIFSGVIQDNISLVKIGAGTLTLSGTNTYTGTTVVNDGVLEVTGSSIEDGTALSINGGKVRLNGTETVDTLFLDGAPQLAGTYGGTGSGADHILPDSFIDGSPGDVLNVLSDAPEGGYDSWADGIGEGFDEFNNGAFQDADNDGTANVLEYVLGGNPLVSDTSILPTQTPDPDTFIFSFTRSHASMADVALAFEYGSDLDGWTPVAIGEASAPPMVSITEGVDPESDTVTIAIPKAGNDKLFGRLKTVK